MYIIIKEFLITTYWGALIWLLLGFTYIKYDLMKRKTNDPREMYGWFGAFGFIITGIAIIIMKILGKL